jgi:hypothetical protein
LSQSATLYRISEDDFLQLKNSQDRRNANIVAKSYSNFQGSFCGGIEFVLSKGKDSETIELINQIFTPREGLGKEEFDGLSDEETFDFIESGNFIPYHDHITIFNINNFLVSISKTTVQENYDSKELNEKGVYPYIWHDDTSPDKAYNERHIIEDVEQLKNIFKEADAEQDYIIVIAE